MKRESNSKQRFRSYLRGILGATWINGHADTVDAWWKMRIVGGMFRAGQRAAPAKGRK